jgi:short-subunit dehydrogenase
MPKVVLIGGSSEIGFEIVKEIQAKNPTKFNHRILISTSLIGKDCIQWKPENAFDVESTLSKVEFETDDIVVIAIGKLIGTGLPTQVTLPEVEAGVLINFELPLYALIYCYKQLADRGGGNIVVLSSAAAFPVLPPNLFYGTMKKSLDIIARNLRESESKSKVRISVVRSGFVATKLNKGRKPTPFAQTAEEVAKTVYKKLGKKIIWTPWYLVYISRLLTFSKSIRKLASKKIQKSFQG